ncbi:MAG: hypothetical protein NZ888_05255 [Candidatus Nitrosocaldus sp.]|nr:hypothetical protein [Candidatus Nitrosocaldus sp.]MDW8000495.1 hypothetical protein [Candidatus Nitrosocaldus sp.]
MISIVLTSKDRRLMLDLASYIAEHHHVIPVLKHDRIVLDELVRVDVQDVCSSIKSFLASSGLAYIMHVDHEGRRITLYGGSHGKGSRDRDGAGDKDRGEGEDKGKGEDEGHDVGDGEHATTTVLICPHCNYTTEYEDILNLHMRAHYA